MLFKPEKQCEFTHKGYLCRIYGDLRPEAWSNHMCGYVRLPADHFLYGKDGADIDQLAIVHGGVTYTSGELFGDESGWWVGFDCAHYTDARKPNDERGTYRSLLYVFHETYLLATQLADLEESLTG